MASMHVAALTFMPFVGSLGFLLLCATFAWGTQVLYTTIIVFFMLVPVIQMPMLVLNCSSGLGVCRSTAAIACCCGVVLLWRRAEGSPTLPRCVPVNMVGNACEHVCIQPRPAAPVRLCVPRWWWQLARSLTRRFVGGGTACCFCHCKCQISTTRSSLSASSRYCSASNSTRSLR